MKYQEGKIYKIIGSGLTYYGSTYKSLNIRFNDHKSKLSCSSKQIIELGNAVIELIELFPCETLNELLWRERWYIENNECVNINLPILTEEERIECIKEYSKQYKIDNKEKNAEQNKQWYLDNKEYVKKYSKQYKIDNKEKINQYELKRKEEKKYIKNNIY